MPTRGPERAVQACLLCSRITGARQGTEFCSRAKINKALCVACAFRKLPQHARNAVARRTAGLGDCYHCTQATLLRRANEHQVRPGAHIFIPGQARQLRGMQGLSPPSLSASRRPQVASQDVGALKSFSCKIVQAENIWKQIFGKLAICTVF